MFLKHWILAAAFIAVAYASAIEPLTLTNIEESQDVPQPKPHIREKRFLLKKALLLGGLGGIGLGVGLAKGALLAHHLPVHSYPVYGYPVYGYPDYGYPDYGYPGYGHHGYHGHRHHGYPYYGYGGGW